MGLLDKIEELQKKPESYRKKVLAVLLVLIMSAIVLVWLSTLNLSGGARNDSPPPVFRETKTGVEYAPFEMIKGATANIKNILNKVTDLLNKQ